MEVLTIDMVIEKLEAVKDIHEMEDRVTYLGNLLPSIRISTQSLGYCYSYILESIKMLITVMSNEECIINYSDVPDAIDGVLRVLKHITRETSKA